MEVLSNLKAGKTVNIFNDYRFNEGEVNRKLTQRHPPIFYENNLGSISSGVMLANPSGSVSNVLRSHLKMPVLQFLNDMYILPLHSIGL